jgi:hypothetical membrane protein
VRIGPLGVAGIGAALMFIGGWVVAGVVSATADVSRGTIGDLGAATADRAWVWNTAATVAGVLVLGVAVGLYHAFRRLPGTAVALALLALVGATLAASFPFRRDCLSTEPSCGADADYSWHHVGRELTSPFGSVGTMIALVLLTRVFGRKAALRPLWRYSAATVAALTVLLVVYVERDGGPGAGIVQRLSTIVFFAWLAFVSYRVERTELEPDSPEPRRVVRRQRRRT